MHTVSATCIYIYNAKLRQQQRHMAAGTFALYSIFLSIIRSTRIRKCSEKRRKGKEVDSV